MEPGSYWGCIVDDVGDSEADDANAVNVKGSGTYVRVVAFTGSSQIVGTMDWRRSGVITRMLLD